MLIDAQGRDPVEPAGSVDQTTPTLGENRTVRGMPGHPQTGRGAGHREMVDHDRRQRPPEPATRDLRPRRGGLRGVLPPRLPAVRAPVAAHPDQQCRGPVPERLMREPTHHGVSRDAFRAALPAPGIVLDDAALDHRPIRLEMLTYSLEAELVETAERGQAGRGEGSLEHVEVFRMGSVGTSILEDLDAYPAIDPRTSTTPSTAKSPHRPSGRQALHSRYRHHRPQRRHHAVPLARGASRRSRAGIGHGPTRHIAGAVVGREEVYSRDNDNG